MQGYAPISGLLFEWENMFLFTKAGLCVRKTVNAEESGGAK